MIAHGLTPILNVGDFGASIAWFEKLGWRKLWEYGDPPTFGVVGSGACEISSASTAKAAAAVTTASGYRSGSMTSTRCIGPASPRDSR